MLVGGIRPYQDSVDLDEPVRVELGMEPREDALPFLLLRRLVRGLELRSIDADSSA
jgi:hypothetical protein